MERLRVGIIGCGEVVQAIHRPTLLGLAHHFQIEACTDAASSSAEAFARSTGCRALADPFTLIEDAGIDVVLVATPDIFHAEHVMAACEAGKRAVLVEKPLTMTARIAKDIEQCARRTKAAVVVGTPHLFDPAVDRAKRAWIGQTRLIDGQFRTVVGPNDQFVGDVTEVFRPKESPSDAGKGRLNYKAAAAEILGCPQATSNDVTTYRLLTGLNSHDIPVMRALLGQPDEVMFASSFGPRAMSLSVIIRFGDGRVSLTTTVVATREVDWGFDLRGTDRVVSVSYPSTYAATASSRCSVRSASDGAIREETWRESYVTGFRREWLHLHALATSDQTRPDDGLASAVLDLELIEEILRAVRR